MKNVIVSLCLILTLFSCASTTIIRSPGARIYADGAFIGEDVASYSDKKIAGSQTLIEVKKDGQNKAFTINRSGQLNVGALVGGVLLAPTFVGLLFFLWITDYNSHYNLELDPKAAK